MLVSKNGLDIIKEFEGLSLKPYLCPAGKATIGFGSTYYPDGKKVTLQDEAITEEKALEMLEFIANKDFGNNVKKAVKVPLTQNQFDSLVSFAYNVGNGNFNWSTLLKKLNRGDYEGASNEFERWNQSNGKVLKGLVKRRLSEKELFLKQHTKYY